MIFFLHPDYFIVVNNKRNMNMAKQMSIFVIMQSIEQVCDQCDLVQFSTYFFSLDIYNLSAHYSI